MKLRWAALLAAVGVTAVILATSVIREHRHQKKLVAILNERRQALVTAEDKTERMRDRAEFFKTEEGQAWIARDKLNMAFGGEKIYRIEE